MVCRIRFGWWGTQRGAVDANDDASVPQPVEQGIHQFFLLEQIIPGRQVEDWW